MLKNRSSPTILYNIIILYYISDAHILRRTRCYCGGDALLSLSPTESLATHTTPKPPFVIIFALQTSCKTSQRYLSFLFDCEHSTALNYSYIRVQIVHIIVYYVPMLVPIYYSLLLGWTVYLSTIGLSAAELFDV